MNRAVRSIVWLLVIFVGVTVSLRNLDDIAATIEDLTPGWTDPDPVDVDHDNDISLTLQFLPLNGSERELQARPYDQPAIAQLLPTSPARLLSLRL